MTGWRTAVSPKASSASSRRRKRCRRPRRPSAAPLNSMNSVAEAHATLGVILALYDWDWPGAERELMRSIELNGASPVRADVYAFYFCGPRAGWRKRSAETQQALSLDPLSILFRVHLGFLFYLQSKYEHSIAQFRKVLEMNPELLSCTCHDGATVYTQPGSSTRLWPVTSGAGGRRGQQIHGFARGDDARRGRASGMKATAMLDEHRPPRRQRLHFARQHRLYLHGFWG